MAKKKGKGKKLSLKETRFVDAFLGDARGNGTEAVVLAGYTGNRNSARVLATRLLAKVAIGQAIAARQGAQSSKSIADAIERDEMLTEIARRTKNATKERISAIKELNKCTGRHSVKHLVEGKLTLEQVLADSRK